jgi:murein DD-endopeptidase MepM/ murein hydrolase activator NlpD
VGLGACRHAAAPESVSVRLQAAHEEPELIVGSHRVMPGETLYRISHAYGLTPGELAAANRMEVSTPLHVGQELMIPGGQGEGAAQQARTPGQGSDGEAGAGATREGEEGPSIQVPAPTSAQPDESGRLAPPTAAKGSLDWPLRGVLYARFGKKGKEPHDGIDLAAPVGTPVKTAAPGRVIYAGEQRGYGLIVIIEHANDLVTVYAHNHDLRVKTGQLVRATQVIATVGESGRTTGPHLHFEVRKAGTPVDPLLFLGAPPSA